MKIVSVRNISRIVRSIVLVLLVLNFSRDGQATQQSTAQYQPADLHQRPRSGQILPEKFLRGYDPITVYFSHDKGPGSGAADDGQKYLSIQPAWPGAWTWLDRRSLQFRPAEAWPPLRRFAVKAERYKRVLTTMMSAPLGMQPRSGSDNLKPFRKLQIRFAQTLPLQDLRKMLRLELRDPPGLGDAPSQAIKDFSLALMPRKSQRDVAVYNIGFDENIPEGKELIVTISLALGLGEKTLWTGKLNTRPQFHLQSVHCGDDSIRLFRALHSGKDTALSCGSEGSRPRLSFSADLGELSLSQVKRLVKLEPAVQGLSFRRSGSVLALEGKFVPDLLYRMKLHRAPIVDSSGRKLQDPGDAEVYFYLGWRKPFVRWEQARNILERQGPRELEVFGYAEARADLRIYKIDPGHKGLWPFPANPVVVDERKAPPFPGEEPEQIDDDLNTNYIDSNDLKQHLRMLGSPLVSRIVDLPLAKHGGNTHFGLNIGKLLDPVVGAHKPGHYLLGLRSLSGDTKRSYVRVQITNLSLSAVEDRDQVVMFVRSLDKAQPVAKAKVKLEFVYSVKDSKGHYSHSSIDSVEATTDKQGQVRFRPNTKWNRPYRITVSKGDDVLIINPRNAPPRFADNHWSPSSRWLQWLGEKVPAPNNEKLLGYVFTERPIYRPGEAVHIKAFVRHKSAGLLQRPGDMNKFGLVVEGPGDENWTLLPKTSSLASLAADFDRKELASGYYQVKLIINKTRQVLSRRTFQIESYRIPTFEVQLAGDATVRLDKPFQIKALARYYAGGTLGTVPVKWKISQIPYHYVPKGRAGFIFADSSQFARSGRRQRNKAQRQQASLDDKGSIKINIDPSLDIDGSARIYRTEVTVTDVDNQQVSAVQETRALPPFVLGLKLQRYLPEAKKIKPEIIAVGVDNKLLKGQEVTVKLYRRLWHSHLRETDFSTGKASYFTDQEDKLLKSKKVKTQAKAIAVPFNIKQAGVYLVELIARDRLGRVQRLSADFYTGGKESLAWKKPQNGLFELATDKKSYKPGEQARMIIKSPFSKGWALVVEEQPQGNKYSWVQVKGGKAVHNIKVRTEHVPNLPVHVLLMRGRLGEGSNLVSDDRYRPRSLAASKDIVVAPVQNKVSVKVKHPETQRPGSLCNFDISLKDERGRPLSGEVTLWLVDEAVLSLAKEAPLDPLEHFIVHNKRRSSLRDSRNLVVGRLLEREESPGGDGDEDEDGTGSGMGRQMVRKNFKTVPYYKATLKIGKNGRLRVPIRLSDDLTNFKVRAVAVSGFSRFGNFEDRLRVRLPVLVQPQLPRFVRMGDKFWAGGIARLLEGAEGPAELLIDVKGPVSDMKGNSKGKRNIQLRAGEANSQLFAYSAKTTAPDLKNELSFKMQVTRKSDGVGDAFEVKIPLLPDLEAEHHAEILVMKAQEKKNLKAFAETPRPGSGQFTVTATSVPGLLQAMAGLDALNAYPHGCAEQKMSQLMARMEVGKLLNELGMKESNKALRRQLDRMIAELTLFQDAQGFIAYWPGGPGNTALTAQALEFIQSAEVLGSHAPDALKQKIISALQSLLRSDSVRVSREWGYNIRSLALRALSLVNADDENYLIDMFHDRQRMDLTSLANLAQVMAKRPSLYKSNIAALREQLWASVEFKLLRGKRIVKGMRWVRSWGDSLYLGSHSASMAEVLKALSALSPSDKRLPLLAQALLNRARAWGGFGSTYNNRVSIEAISSFLHRSRANGETIKLRLNQHEIDLNAQQRVQLFTQRSDKNPVAKLSQGQKVSLRVASVSVPNTSGDKIAALREGFVISRSSSLYPAAGGAPEHQQDQQGQSLRVKVGDILELHTSIVIDKSRHHVAVVIPFAAGLELMNPELKNSDNDAKPAQSDSIGADYVQRLDNEVRYYFFTLPAGTHSLHFRVRATVEGRFVQPPPHAEQMYHPEVRGRGVGSSIVVTGTHQQ